MQRPHRRAHLRLWVLLSIVVGALFVFGILLRQDRPVETQRIQVGAAAIPSPAVAGEAV